MFISSALRIFLSSMYGEMCTVFGYRQSTFSWHSFVCSVAPDDSHFSLMLSRWCTMDVLWLANVSHCTSNLTGVLLVDYLVVILVYSFDKEFVADFFPTWRQYLSLFSWTHIFILDWCLESKVISLDLHSLDIRCYFRGCSYYSFYCCILLPSFSKVVWYDHSQWTCRLKIFLLL